MDADATSTNTNVNACRERAGRRKSNNPKKVALEAANVAPLGRMRDADGNGDARPPSNATLTDADDDADADADADATIDNACGAQMCAGADSLPVSRTSSNTGTGPLLGTGLDHLHAAASDRDRDRNLTTLVRVATLRLVRQSTPITNARVQDAVIELEARYATENRKILGDKIKKRLLRIGCAFDHANNCWSPGSKIETALALAIARREPEPERELEPGEVDTRMDAPTAPGYKSVPLPSGDASGIDVDARSTRRSISVSTCTSASDVRATDADARTHPDAQAEAAADADRPKRQREPEPEAETTSVSPSPAASASDVAGDDPLLADVSTVLEELHAANAAVSVLAIRSRLPCGTEQKTMSDRIRRRLLMLGYTYDAVKRTYTRSGVAVARCVEAKSDKQLAVATPAVGKADGSPAALPHGDDAVLAMAGNLVRKYTDCSVVVTTAGIREELRRAIPSLCNATYDQSERDRLSQLVRSQLTSLGYVHDALTETWQPASACVQQSAAPVQSQSQVKSITSPIDVTKSAAQAPVAAGDQLLAAANLAPMVESIVRTWTSEHRLFTVQDVRRTLIVVDRRFKRCDHTKLTKRISRQLRQLGCRYDATQEKWRLVIPGRFRPLNVLPGVVSISSLCKPAQATFTDDNDNDDAVENRACEMHKSGLPPNADDSAANTPDVLLSEARLTPLIRAAIARFHLQSHAQTITSPDIIEQLVLIDDRYATLDRKVLRNRIGYRLQYKLGYRFDSEGDFWFREAKGGAPLPRRTKAKLALQLATGKPPQLNGVVDGDSNPADQPASSVESTEALDLTATSSDRANETLHSVQRAEATVSDSDQKTSRKAYTYAEYEAAVRQIAHAFSDPSSTRRLTIREVANELASRGMRYHHSKVSDMLKRVGCRFNASLNVWTVGDGDTDGDGDVSAEGERAVEISNTVRVKKVSLSSSKQASAVREIVLEMDGQHEAVTKDKVAFALQKRGIEVGSGLLNELLHRAGFAYSEQKRRWVQCDDTTIPTKAYRNRHAVVLSPSSVNVSATPPAHAPVSPRTKPHCATKSDSTNPVANGATLAAKKSVATRNSSSTVRSAPIKKRTAQTEAKDTTAIVQSPLNATRVNCAHGPSPKRSREDADPNANATVPPEDFLGNDRLLEEHAVAVKRKIARSARASLPTFVDPKASSNIHIGLSEDETE